MTNQDLERLCSECKEPMELKKNNRTDELFWLCKDCNETDELTDDELDLL